MRALTLVALLVALSACRTDPDKPDTDTLLPTDDTGPNAVDADGDGYDSDEDCNDADASVHPGADEYCDGIDNDCDELVDEDALDATTWYADADSDGFGDPDGSLDACDQPEGHVDVALDCDDSRDDVYPDAPERCDGVDNDCDGEVDEDLNETWYADADGDGYGNAERVLDSCDPGEGWVVDDTDCDDGDSSINPGAAEQCNDLDDDCDGDVDEELESTWYADADSDGFGDPSTETFDCEPGTGWVADDQDCDDANSSINPDATELCDTLDNDCDGLIDDDDPSVADALTWYGDGDGDGFGDDASTTTACEQPSGTAEYGGDCDDSDAAYNPGAAETDCTDPADYNCDGSTGYTDGDGDGFAACEDCDDSDASINPDAAELCDNDDNDCDGDIDEDDAIDADTWYADGDGDGFGDPASTTAACDQPSGYVSATYATDCDDTDASVSPVDPELCDGIDNDCDGDTDEGVTDTFYVDGDGDGYGDATSTTEACSVPSGYSADDSDCDDGDASVNPAATELCDGIDDDCDGAVDEADAADAATWYRDGDLDGYGSASASTVSCDQPSGYVADAADCDDGDDDIHPGADEHCDGVDEDCDGDVDEAAVDADTWYADTDADGYGDPASSTTACTQPSGYVADTTDCDDGEAAINPAAAEVCDGLDNDCDGLVDDDDSSVTGTSTWYYDADEDGYGGARLSVAACDAPSGYVADFTDCDDLDSSSNPGAAETCDGADNDCDGTVDEPDAADALSWYADSDGDGYGDSASSSVACDAPSGTVADASDCDDGDAAINPAASEVCDGVDNDCDGLVDGDDASVTGSATWYADSDGDGYGDATSSTEACSVPAGYVADATDCDDGDGATNPAASEVCDSVDNDCDGLVDDDDSSVTGTTVWYADYDSDGYGGSWLSVVACTQPSGFVSDDTDCDDGDASAWPGAEEVCDGADNDCDGTVDEPDATDASTWYADSDGDGYGDASDAQIACSQPSGHGADDTDCDDGDAAINPGAGELCNGVDDDCDGLLDEDDPDITGTSTWYTDGDGDGFGDAGSTTVACSQPSGTVADDSDCADGDATVNPDAIELCDAVDNDCDGTVDEDDASDASTWYADNDADGYGDASSSTAACLQPSDYVSDSSDCDDHDDDVHPYASETCDGDDEDCDGTVDEGAIDMSTWYTDADGDSYGDASATSEACSEPSGYVGDDSDCDDGDAAINPAASDDCDGVDNDCDGTLDEDAADADTWYIDVDGDGYGSSSYTTSACAQPSGYVGDDSDCDDLDGDIYPGATELCDGVDQDCDGTVDEGATDPGTWYADSDGDGYGDASSTTTGCEAPTGYTDDDTDCDDGAAAVNPGASEVCNGVDDDCDGVADTGVMGSGELCAADSCLEALIDDPGATDGTYWVFLDGVATEVLCDMTEDGGGWTLIFSDDFESSVDPGWSLSTTYSCGSFGTLLGGYGIIANGEIDIDLDCYGIAHSEAWVDLDYAAIDSWDGETAYVEVDAATIASWSQNNHSSAYGEVCGWDRGYYGSYDSLTNVDEIFTHSGGSMTLIVGSTLDQSATDESFGIGEAWVWVR